jgi:hypothetical protein
MTNPFLQQKIDEKKRNLGSLSAGELNDLLESTRGKFDEPLTGEDRNHYLDLFRSVHEEHARRHPSAPGQMRQLVISEELRVELAGMDNEALAKAISNSEATVHTKAHVDKSSPGYRSEYSRLGILNVERTRRQELERQQHAAEVEKEKQRQLAADVQAKKTGNARSALDDSLAGV